MAGKPMCPKYCGVHLQRVKAGSLEVDQCPKCEGVWFDTANKNELIEILRLGRDNLPPQLVKSWKLDKVRQTRSKSKGYNCPRCGALLRGYWYGAEIEAGQTFVIESCRKGCGMWLDDGELAIARTIVSRTAPDMLMQKTEKESILQKIWRFFKQ